MKTPSRATVRANVTGWGLSAPYVALLLAFGLAPALYAIYESFTDGPQGRTSPGIGNYRTVFNDFRFVPAIMHVLTFMAIWIPVMVIGAVALALLLHERVGRFSGVMRLIFFLPGAVTGSAAVLLWYFMLNPQLSPFGAELRLMGWRNGNDVFTNGHLALIFALVAFTTGVGSWVVIMFGAFQAVPAELIEAARVDGAGPMRIALSIKLPLVTKYIVYMVILCFAAAMQIFVEPTLFFSITNAGSDWWSLNQLGYSYAFQQGQFGQAATVSCVLLVVSALVAFVFVKRADFFQTEADS